ncbi:rod-binding protein [Roseovarius aestuarii]|nr:rod-binding protein [Roseovarius aestuarii]
MPVTDPLPVSPPQRAAHARITSALSPRQAAEKLEASFLVEMLKAAGIGKSPSFSGGIGEDQFASYQRQALADKLVQSGGIGLAESFYQSLAEKHNDQ